MVPNEAKNEKQIWCINYGKELQGLVITNREIESHYYDIHTALFNVFSNYSCTILILEGSTSYPGLFASAVGWSAKKALASAGLFCNLIGQ